jgi:hypothetical protein
MWLGNAVAGFDEDASMLKTGTPELPRFFLSWRAETGSLSFAKGKQNENELKERAFPFFTQHLRASVCAKPRPRWLDPSLRSRTGYAGLLSAAPFGAGFS